MTDIDDNLKKGFELVTDYREFNKTCKYENCENELDELIERFYDMRLDNFIEVGNTLYNWKEYIINSFIPLEDCFDEKGHARRLSNGPVEGNNLLLEKINLNANGYQNFWRFRNRCMFVINKDISQIKTLVRKPPLIKIDKEKKDSK